MVRQLTADDIHVGDLVYVTHESAPLLGLVLQRTLPREDNPESGASGASGACVIAYLYQTGTYGSYTGFTQTIINMKYITKTGWNLFQWLESLPMLPENITGD